MGSFVRFLLKEKGEIKVSPPDVRQTRYYDCAPASVKAIAKYFKVVSQSKSEDFFIELCGSNQEEGTPPPNVVKAIEKLGLKVDHHTGFTVDELKKALDEKKPVICDIQAWHDKWKQNYETYKDDYKKLNDGHYVVAIGYDEDNIYFEEPAIKKSRGYLPWKEFLERWADKDDDGKLYYRSAFIVWKEDMKDTAKDDRTNKKRLFIK